MSVRDGFDITAEDRVALEPFANTCDAIVQLVREEAPYLLPAIGELAQMVFHLAGRVQKLESAHSGEQAT